MCYYTNKRSETCVRNKQAEALVKMKKQELFNVIERLTERQSKIRVLQKGEIKAEFEVCECYLIYGGMCIEGNSDEEIIQILNFDTVRIEKTPHLTILYIN